MPSTDLTLDRGVSYPMIAGTKVPLITSRLVEVLDTAQRRESCVENT